MRWKLSIGCLSFARFQIIRVSKYGSKIDRNLNFRTRKSFTKVNENNLETNPIKKTSYMPISCVFCIAMFLNILRLLT